MKAILRSGFLALAIMALAVPADAGPFEDGSAAAVWFQPNKDTGVLEVYQIKFMAIDPSQMAVEVPASLLDDPDERSSHRVPMPTAGGLGIIAGFWSGWGILSLAGDSILLFRVSPYAWVGSGLVLLLLG